MIKNQILAASICFAMLITGCKKQNDLNPSSETTNPVTVHNDIEEHSGVLRFKNWGVFKNTITKLEKSEKVSLPSSFISLDDVFKEVVAAEAELAKKNTAESAVANGSIHSDIYNKNKNSIYYTTIDNGSVILDMNIYSNALAQLVNVSGLVLVNDSLFIYSRDKADLCLDYTEETLKNFQPNEYKAMGISTKQIITIKKIEEPENTSSSINRTPCGYCYNDDYHYNTTIWNNNLSNSYQTILEVFVEQIRSNCSVTETNVKARGRFLTRFPFTGSWVPYQPTDIYFSGEFSGPRGPSTSTYPNAHPMTWFGFGTDLTLPYCYDFNSAGPTNCFYLEHATFKLLTAYAPFTTTDVIW